MTIFFVLTMKLLRNAYPSLISQQGFFPVPLEVWIESLVCHWVQIRQKVARELWKILKLKLVWRTILLLLFTTCTDLLRTSSRECVGTAASAARAWMFLQTVIRDYFWCVFEFPATCAMQKSLL